MGYVQSLRYLPEDGLPHLSHPRLPCASLPVAASLAGDRHQRRSDEIEEAVLWKYAQHAADIESGCVYNNGWSLPGTGGYIEPVLAGAKAFDSGVANIRSHEATMEAFARSGRLNRIAAWCSGVSAAASFVATMLSVYFSLKPLYHVEPHPGGRGPPRLRAQSIWCDERNFFDLAR